jgi:hypothetical protein
MAWWRGCWTRWCLAQGRSASATTSSVGDREAQCTASSDDLSVHKHKIVCPTTIGVSMLKTSAALVRSTEGASAEGMGSTVNVSSALVTAEGDLRDDLCSDGVFSLHMTSWKENIHSCGNSSTASESGEQVRQPPAHQFSRQELSDFVTYVA